MCPILLGHYPIFGSGLSLTLGRSLGAAAPELALGAAEGRRDLKISPSRRALGSRGRTSEAQRSEHRGRLSGTKWSEHRGRPSP